MALSAQKRILCPDAGTVRETRFVTSSGSGHAQHVKKPSQSRYFKTSPEVIRLAVMM
jgi:hypothetical protein